ncbi:MAG TPA: hypothetical protein VIL21_01675 [Solirubrobacterales bacterium]
MLGGVEEGGSGLLRDMRLVACAFLALALLGLAAAAPGARADQEPGNDMLVGAEGPLAGGIAYKGTTSDESPIEGDWYFFYAGSQVQLDIRVWTTDECENSELVDDAVVALTDANGEEIYTAWLYPTIGVDENHIKFTTPPGGGQYYLHAGCGGYPEGKPHYNFSIAPATGVLLGPSPWRAPVPLGEPNETAGEAIGPLVGDVDYEGATSTINDPDWFYFYTLKQYPLDILTTPREGCRYSEVTLRRPTPDGDLEWVADIEAEPDHVGHLHYTSPGGVGLFYLEASCSGMGAYRFRINPGAALPSVACITAIQERTAARRRVVALRVRLRRARNHAARSPRARHRLKRTIRKVIKPKLRAALVERAQRQSEVKANCA